VPESEDLTKYCLVSMIFRLFLIPLPIPLITEEKHIYEIWMDEITYSYRQIHKLTMWYFPEVM
jgi:hypothetical protein